MVTIEQLQKYATYFHESSIVTRVIIPKPMHDTNIIVLSKIFTTARGYKMCTICSISPYTNDIVIEAYKLYEEINIPYVGGIELCDSGEVPLKSGYSYIIHLDEAKYIPLLILDSSQIPTIELVEHAPLTVSSTSNPNNKKIFIKQIFQVWFSSMFILYCIYLCFMGREANR